MDTLIDPVTRRWNEELVDRLFVVEDVEMIKKIPLSRSVAKDTLYWPYSSSGHYTCRFGYRFLLMAISEAQVEGRSRATRTKRSWQTDGKPIKPKWQE